MNQPLRALFGRDSELADAKQALDAAASRVPQVLLVGGDAGIGKTTLIEVIAEHARDSGFNVLVGHCLDIESAVALRPVREALRQAVIGRAEDELAPGTRRLVPYLRGETDQAGVDELGLVVAELAAEGPTLLVLEDMHWADRSTIELATVTARTAEGPLCLALTCRSDELTRHHPFREALVDLARSPGARRLDLAPLNAEQIAALAAARSDVFDPALVDAVFARSEGNPLYAEELLAAGGDRLPEPLNDLLLSRLDMLSHAAREVLRLASAHGSRLSPELLVEVTGLDETAVDAVLREAIDVHVLRTIGENVDFRHGLLREAVYDDLMPGERATAHRLLAEAVERMAGEQPGMIELGLLSYHWHAAHDLPNAYRAAVRAGRRAHDLESLEAVPHLERALQLYDRVPHAEGPAKADLLVMLARTHGLHWERDRANELIAQALDLVDEEADPRLAARIYTAYAGRVDELPGRLSHEEAWTRALHLLDESPDEDLVRALIIRGAKQLDQERLESADASLARASDLAADLGLPWLESSALFWGGLAHVCLGDLSGALARFDAAARIDTELGMEERLLRNRKDAALTMIYGIDIERGVALADEVRMQARTNGWPEIAAQAGLDATLGLLLGCRLDEADRLLASVIEDGPFPADHYEVLVPQARLALMRGETARALTLARRQYEQVMSFGGMPDWDWLLLHAQVLLANNLVEEAHQKTREWLTVFAESESPPGRGIIAHAAYLAIDAARRSGMPEDAAPTEQVDDFLRRMVGQLTVEAHRSFFGYSTLVALALRAELRGEPSVELWRAAYDAAAHVGAGLALPIRLRLVAALLAVGERDEVRTALPELAAAAKAMGANGILADAVKLGRRHRIPVPGDERPSKLDILTAREREVLELLVTGATNRAIAERLFITEKTVSVHVTNLLAKLGVTNRTEAAALARDLSLVD